MAKQKKSTQKAFCPCCKKSIEQSQTKKTNAANLGFIPFFQNWACDRCIKDGKALLAEPKKQFYQFTYPWDHAIPFLAYYDIHFTCKACKEPFLFSKSEQQYWYEKLQFVVYSKPQHCKECRKEIRTAKNLNTELSNLLKEGKPTDKKSLLRIAEIYKEMGKPEKMKAYLAAAEKLKD